MACDIYPLAFRHARDQRQYVFGVTLPRTCSVALTTLQRRQFILRKKQRMEKVAEKVLLLSDVLLIIFDHFYGQDVCLDKRALSLASKVCKNWYRVAAPKLYALVRDPQIFENCLATPGNRVNYTCYVKHLEIALGAQLWKGDAATMPNFDRLQTLEIIDGAASFGKGGAYMQRLLRPSLLDIRVTRWDSLTRTLQNDSIWLRHLEQCVNLKRLTLATPLSSSEMVELERFLLNASLTSLILTCPLETTISPWTHVIALGMNSLQTLSIDRPLTKQAFSLLKSQCGGTLPMLNNMKDLTVRINVDAQEVTVSLLALTPNLLSLCIMLDSIRDRNPWQPDHRVFGEISQLKNLEALFIRVDCQSADFDTPQPRRTFVTGADLMTLGNLDNLKTLCVIPQQAAYTKLHLCDIEGSQMAHLLIRWKSLKCLELGMSCREVLCNQREATDIKKALSTCKLNIKYLILQPEFEVEVPEDIWLGSSKAFQPDAQPWEWRSLEF